MGTQLPANAKEDMYVADYVGCVGLTWKVGRPAGVICWLKNALGSWRARLDKTCAKQLA